MKFSLCIFTFIALFFFATTTNALPQYSSDVVLGRRDIERLIPELEKRNGKTSQKWTKKQIPTLAADIMIQIKAKVKASILVDITTKFCDDIKASLDINLKALLGIIEIDDAHVALAQKTVIKGLDVKIQAQIEAQLDAQVYAQIEVALTKALGSSCDEDKLLKVLLEIDAKLAALLKVKLPKIAASISADVKAAIDLGIKHAKVKIPLLLDIDISLNVDVAVTLKACVKAVISACADISAKVWAKAILNAVL
ncbi:hypothetical protein INT44_006636 [Umbelopsis vinacea]|uniref:Uncharacterized protein n=1 Tax=Umbelopsis vinacea TaxID=44442 RepID=A0A8H7UA61_9FUNG|nr:hypothetical protein INT44_006636 [Umbelopsis vinacea]